MNKIRSFTDLTAWREGHSLVLHIYKLTKSFPSDEKFCLIDQMRRSVISITSNIAEGFSRKGRKEKVQFFYTSLGSTSELQNQLLISRDLGYIPTDIFQEVAVKTVVVSKLLNGLIKSAKLLTT